MKHFFTCVFVVGFLSSLMHGEQGQYVDTIEDLRRQPKLLSMQTWSELCKGWSADDIVVVVGVNPYVNFSSSACSDVLSLMRKCLKIEKKGWGHTALFCMGRGIGIKRIHVARSSGIENKVACQMDDAAPILAELSHAIKEINTTEITRLAKELEPYSPYCSVHNWSRNTSDDEPAEDQELRRKYGRGELKRLDVERRKNDLVAIVSPSEALKDNLKVYQFLLSGVFGLSDWDYHLMVQRPEEVTINNSYTIIPATAIAVTREEYGKVCKRILDASSSGGRIIDERYELGKWGHNCDDAVTALLDGIIAQEKLGCIKSPSYARVPLYRLRLSDPERKCWQSIYFSIFCVNKSSQVATCVKGCW